MSILVKQNFHISNPTFCSSKQDLENKTQVTEKKDSDKKLMYSLIGLGTIALGALAYKHFKKVPKNANTDIKKIIDKNIKVKDLTEAEKEKLIKELQAKTDNPDTKTTIRKLIESGDWDNL